MKLAKRIIGVASAKGGVGKSTTAVNVAVSLSQDYNLKVALLDADIYGPSVPMLLGTDGIKARVHESDSKEEEEEGAEKKQKKAKLEPVRAYGIEAMSMGYLVERDSAMIWRGLIVMSVLRQLLFDVAWSRDLDVMVIDMPPGTGDVQLSLSQEVSMSGAVVVSTPQDIALADARRGVAMFRQVDVPVLGIVQNMSTFVCPKCEHATPIFGDNGARHTAAELGVDFLGDVPLQLDIRQTSDTGQPIVASRPDSIAAQHYRHIADRIQSSDSGASERSRIAYDDEE
jgi:ATP-binding protein involved in chromosome partitioning